MAGLDRRGDNRSRAQPGSVKEGFQRLQDHVRRALKSLCLGARLDDIAHLEVSEFIRGTSSKFARGAASILPRGRSQLMIVERYVGTNDLVRSQLVRGSSNSYNLAAAYHTTKEFETRREHARLMRHIPRGAPWRGGCAVLDASGSLRSRRAAQLNRLKGVGMAYVIAEPCIGTKDNACTEVCPVDCIHPTRYEAGYDEVEQLHVDPDECIDCDACVEACPVDACFSEDRVPAEWGSYIKKNADYFAKS
jgi:ferredoxin